MKRKAFIISLDKNLGIVTMHALKKVYTGYGLINNTVMRWSSDIGVSPIRLDKKQAIQAIKAWERSYGRNDFKFFWNNEEIFIR